MKLKKIAEILEAEAVTETDSSEKDIMYAFSTDLLSNVLYYFVPNSILITALIHPQVIRAADVAGIECIVFVQNKRPDRDTAELAKKKKIPLFVTPFSMYIASGKLYQAGLGCCSTKK